MVKGGTKADLLRLCGGGGLARASLSFLGHGIRGLYTSTTTRKSQSAASDKDRNTLFGSSGLCFLFSPSAPLFSIILICGDA